MKEKMLALAALCVAPLCSTAAPIHVNGLGGLLSTSFSYSASPAGSPAQLAFATNPPGRAVVGPIGGPEFFGKTVQLSVAFHADMASLAGALQAGSFSQSFAAQGNIEITGLDTQQRNLNMLSARIDSGKIQVNLATQRAIVELQLTSLTSQGLYLTGQPATLTLQGQLPGAVTFGDCAAYTYKSTCLPGEQFLDDFVLTTSAAQGDSWSVSSAAFVSSVPEPASAALTLFGGFVVSRLARRARPSVQA